MNTRPVADETGMKCLNFDIGELVFNKFKIKTNIKGFTENVDDNNMLPLAVKKYFLSYPKERESNE